MRKIALTVALFFIISLTLFDLYQFYTQNSIPKLSIDFTTPYLQSAIPWNDTSTKINPKFYSFRETKIPLVNSFLTPKTIHLPSLNTSSFEFISDANVYTAATQTSLDTILQLDVGANYMISDTVGIRGVLRYEHTSHFHLTRDNNDTSHFMTTKSPFLSGKPLKEISPNVGLFIKF